MSVTLPPAMLLSLCVCVWDCGNLPRVRCNVSLLIILMFEIDVVCAICTNVLRAYEWKSG